MSDIYAEVEEEVRRERLKKLWDQYSLYVYVCAAVIILGVGGWNLLRWYELKQAGEAGARFQAAMQLSEDGKHANAEAALSKLAAEGTVGYRILARFRAASEASRVNVSAAVSQYSALAADNGIGSLLQDYAKLRAAYLLVDTDKYEEVFKRLELLTRADNIWRHQARELLALSAWRHNQTNNLRKWVEMIQTDITTPAGVRGRIEVLQAVSGLEASAS